MCDANLQYLLLRAFLVTFGALMSFTSALTAIKHRFFRRHWLDELTRIEKKLELKPIPRFTTAVVESRKKQALETHFWENWRAEKWMIYSLIFVTGAFIFLSITSFWNVITRLLSLCHAS